jgi:hypothetical protein
MLDYTWKSSESELDRKNRIAIAELQKPPKQKGGFLKAIGSIAGTILGGPAGGVIAGKLFP